MNWIKKSKADGENSLILNISNCIVKKHLHRIFKKLEIFSRIQVLSRYKKAIQN
ncbi:helix-turn-helix transcriptional regulator [Methylotenera sp.]|uniref:helix-turn-helix transcriptional regulator n=1 Tax=Methylotenera sp. TaxID=2051956 RepID=UPI0035205172